MVDVRELLQEGLNVGCLGLGKLQQSKTPKYHGAVERGAAQHCTRLICLGGASDIVSLMRAQEMCNCSGGAGTCICCQG